MFVTQKPRFFCSFSSTVDNFWKEHLIAMKFSAYFLQGLSFWKYMSLVWYIQYFEIIVWYILAQTIWILICTWPYTFLN